MKKILLSVSIVLGASSLFAQITINSNHVAGIGDVVTQSNDTVPSVMLGGTGANQTWNYAGLAAHTNSSLTFTNPNWTPNGASFPNSNLAAIPGNGFGTELYFHKSSSKFDLVGYYGSVAQFGLIPLNLNPGQTVVNFPLNYNDAGVDVGVFDTTAAFTGQVGVDSVRVKSTFTTDYTVDSWGSITTPMGTYDALRIHSQIARVDSVWGHSILGWSFLTEQTEDTETYSYWGDHADTKFTIAEFDVDPANGNVLSVTWLDAAVSPTSVANTDNAKFNVYPNPFNEIVNIKFESSDLKTVNVLDITGKTVYNENISGSQLELDLSGLNNGVYFVKVISGTETKTERIIKR